MAGSQPSNHNYSKSAILTSVCVCVCVYVRVCACLRMGTCIYACIQLAAWI